MSNELESDRAMVATLELLEPMVVVTMRPRLGPVRQASVPVSPASLSARGGPGPSGAYIMTRMASDVDSTAEARPGRPPWPLPVSPARSGPRPGRGRTVTVRHGYGDRPVQQAQDAALASRK